MIQSSLIYVEKDGQLLMLHRTKKLSDPNKGKWIGVGGKFEPGETGEACARREMWEETGLTARELRFRAVVHFRSDVCEDEDMYLFTCDRFSGQMHPCDEGELQWIPREEILSLNLWEGDKEFLKLLAADEPYFELILTYHGDHLVSCEKTV